MFEDDNVDLSAARVLVVDDNELNRKFACLVLERMGLKHVECAVDGREALEKVENFAPDLVLLDLMMPVMDGEEFLRVLRADPARRRLPVLVVSAVTDQETRNQLFALGANDYIGKPIDLHELEARVEVHLRNHLMLADLRRYRDRLAQDLATARHMQHSLLPDRERCAALHERYGLTVDAVFLPSDELGGDLWGLSAVDDRHAAVFTVDFSGHGVAASINTFRLHVLLESLGGLMAVPDLLLARANAALCQILPRGQFATMTAAVFDVDSRVLTLANAGGPAPILALPGEEPRPVHVGGLPLGISPAARFATKDLAFPPGSRLSLFSDAVIDAEGGDGTALGDEGALDLARLAAFSAPERAARTAVEAFLRLVPGDPADDVTWVQIAG